MSDRTLYRLATDEDLKGGIWDEGWLVPSRPMVPVKVEPDYEAAERAFRDDRDEPFANLIPNRLRRAVDAAYGKPEANDE